MGASIGSASYDNFDDDSAAAISSEDELDQGIESTIVSAPQGSAVQRGQQVIIHIEPVGVRLVNATAKKRSGFTPPLYTTSFFQLKSWKFDPEQSTVSITLLDGPVYTFKLAEPEQVYNALTLQVERVMTEIRARDFDQMKTPPMSPMSSPKLRSPRSGANPMSPMSPAQRIKAGPCSPCSAGPPLGLQGAMWPLSLDEGAADRVEEPLSPAQRIKSHRKLNTHSLRKSAHSKSTSPPPATAEPPLSPVLRKDIIRKVSILNTELAELHRTTLDLHGSVDQDLLILEPCSTWQQREATLSHDDQEKMALLKANAKAKDSEIERLMNKLKTLRREQPNPLLQAL